MRLIDVDALKATLLEYGYTTEHNQIFCYIDEQPTAYDIGKVVEEFDKKYNNSLWIKGNEEFSITRNELIEIVKQEGVSDDVCEWEYSSSTGNWDSDTHNKVIKDAIACDWKVCPYCGKKIKVVE